MFYDRDWLVLIDQKSDLSIKFQAESEIQQATTIRDSEIDNCSCGRLDLMPISHKFKLAANHSVTHAKDQAYLIMGLLDKDISITYGKGAEHASY